MVVYYTHITNLLPTELENVELMRLPSVMREKTKRYINLKDRQGYWMGKILLLEGLINLDFPPDSLNWIHNSEFGKPYLDADVHFSISHSEDYVVCAISVKNPVGIDIEKIRPFIIEDYRSSFTEEEYKQVFESKNRLDSFFNFWTRRESVIKLDGRGFFLDPSAIIWDGSTAIIATKKMFTTPVAIAAGYSCHLAAENQADLDNLQLVQRFIGNRSIENDPPTSLGCPTRAR